MSFKLAICFFMLALANASVVHREKAIEPSELMFLKTVSVEVFTRQDPPECIVVFFDSRTLDPFKHRMGYLMLLANPRPSFGTKDGTNEWAAAKTICGLVPRESFMFELNWLLYLHRDVPMELEPHEKEVRKVLRQKITEMAEVIRAEYGEG